MTVQELIDELKQWPADAKVVDSMGDEIDSVRHDPAYEEVTVEAAPV